MLIFIIIILMAALGCGVFWVYRKGWIVLATGGGWLVYGLYELWVQKTCSGECNIRVDLLLIYPLLLVLSLLTLFAVIRQSLRKGKTGTL